MPLEWQSSLIDQKIPNVARAYTTGGNEKKAYSRNLPYCNKCKLHHIGPCTMKCGNCKKVGHMTRDCKTPVAAAIANQRAPLANQKTNAT
ncbi:reverse transcriptase domain-containing protein [Tanacetum coccineum]